MPNIPFTKMHGAGNDFVVIDRRDGSDPLPETLLASIADRHVGVGCDQVVLIEPPAKGADIRFRFYNADGSEAGACGNGTRCAATMVMREQERRAPTVRPWRRAWVVNREELFIMIHRIRSYAVVGSRDAQEKQTSLPQNSMRAPRSSPCKQPFTGPSRTRTLRSFALAKSPVRLTSSPKLIGCESSASLSAPTRFGAMQREQAAPHALS